jgi:hypothetical protein
MGQYHIAVNLTKGQYIRPATFGDGIKLAEFARNGDGMMTGLALLLACDNGRGEGDFPPHPIIGHWSGDRIVIAGDYGVDGKDLPLNWLERWLGRISEMKAQGGHRYTTEDWEQVKPNLYTFAGFCMLDISPLVLEAICQKVRGGSSIPEGKVARLHALLFPAGLNRESSDARPVDPLDTSMFKL